MSTLRQDKLVHHKEEQIVNKLEYVVVDLTVSDCKVISNLMLMGVILMHSNEFRNHVKDTGNPVLITAYNESLEQMRDGSFIGLNDKMIKTYKASFSGGV